MMSKQRPNYIYIRKIASSHDLEKEINVGLPIFKSFFGNEKNLIFTRKNVPGKNYNIEMQSVDYDPRMGKDFKQLLADEGGYDIGDLVIISKKNSTTYQVELIKKTDSQYNAFNQFYTDINSNERHTSIIIEESNIQKNDINNLEPVQTIYYGVPGCGKSYSIENELRKLGITKTMEADCTKRVVFHPEYTNADFIGQILPQSMDNGEKISYSFVAGPFTQILAKSYTHKNTPYALIIEEINRGNAAAIFGELFQLLDRLDKDEVEMSNEVSYQKNWSSYPVTNDNINNEIFAAYDKYKNDKDTCIFEPFIAEENFKKYKLNIGIRLPPNLSILATMNTSDQNVFILDNAFQRRWDMVLVKNEFGEDSEKAKTEEEQKNIDRQKTALIEGSKITWETFHKTINEKISQFSRENNFSSMIDKRLGCWFVKAVPDDKNDINGKYIIEEKSFKNKILKYLWDDAFKFSREDVFEDADNFESLLEKVKMGESNFGIFKNVDFSAEKSESPEA